MCLARLVEHLRARGYTLLDTQASNPHIARLGCVEISGRAYMAALKEAVAAPVAWGRFGLGAGAGARAGGR